MNCHGCRYLDETRPAGNGYCCMVERSKIQNEKVRRAHMPRCELYKAGEFKDRLTEGGQPACSSE